MVTPSWIHIPAAAKTHQMTQSLNMRRGLSLSGVQVVYETWGELNAEASNGVLILTGLSPSSHAASSPQDPTPGWWEDMVGPGKPIDSNRFFVICVNSLGSCFGSTGPASINPASGEPYRLSFPRLSLEDVARAAHSVVSSLGIERLSAVVGASMGGMSALAYALLYPNHADALVSISSAARSLPFSIALRSLQRELIRTDTRWEQGNYSMDAGPVRGMQLARKIGMITYRSAQEWKHRFGRERVPDPHRDGPFGIEFEVESYLEAHAQKFTGGFDANCYLYLSAAMDLFDAADHGAALQGQSQRQDTGLQRVLVIGVKTDILFPLEQQQELAQMLDSGDRDVQLVELPSIQGHDAFLVDMDRFRPVVAGFFNQF